MTSQGSPYARFKRALARGSLHQILAAAAELPHIALDDALAICEAMQGHEQADRAAVRWLARLALERPTVRLDDLRAGLAAFEAFPYNPDGARQALHQLCRRHGVRAGAGSARVADAGQS
jgi:hypothetical protein